MVVVSLFEHTKKILVKTYKIVFYLIRFLVLKWIDDVLGLKINLLKVLGCFFFVFWGKIKLKLEFFIYIKKTCI
jgi:hypothetical protein